MSTPGLQIIQQALTRRRTLSAALLLKEALNHSRAWTTWLRLAVLAVLVLVFPWLHTFLQGYVLPDPVLVVAYAALLAVFWIVDGNPSPIGSEGNRLALYLAAPISLAAILQAKFVTVLVPGLLVGVGLGAATGWWVGLPALDLNVGRMASRDGSVAEDHGWRCGLGHGT